MSDNVSLRQMSYQEIKGIIGELEVKVEELEEGLAFYNCLVAAGVDNWNGYDIAQEMMEDEL